MDIQFNSKEILTASMILFAVIDILGSVPIIISLRKKVGHIQSEKASIVAGIIMIQLSNKFIFCRTLLCETD